MKKICLVLAILLLAGCNAVNIREESPLPVVGSAANLKVLLKTAERQYYGRAKNSLDLAGAVTEAAAPQLNGAASHSTTNVQVQGVDEADVVKTDGTYLYHIAGNKVFITQAWPVSSLAIVKELELDEGFSPLTLFVDDNYLVVIGSQYENLDFSSDLNPERRIMPLLSSSTRLLAFDIRDKENITLSRDISFDGYNVTSRKIDNYLYLVNSRFVGWFDEGQEPALPWYKDAGCGEERTEIDYKDIRYFPMGELNDYLIFAALDLDSGDLKVDTYLGWAQNIYMSHENLYVAMTDWTETTIYRFAVNGTKLDFQGEGKVAGMPLNQFSMDEHKGYFRIATTEHSEQGKTSNNLFVLDKGMKVVGKITGIAPGETIYSARFMGDKGYLVTFEQIDPLFVIDLSNPRAPKILGELKIPGFSNYLHPLDENHLLGIGQNTQVRSYEGKEFVVTNGMKLAIFDVSDVSNPKEKHAEIIGGSGTYSEALYNHKAVFFYQGVLAFPVDYSQLFQGALFYQVDLEKGFKEVGRITHEQIKPEGEQALYFRYPNIKRIVQVEDIYYTVSDYQVLAHDAASFEKMAGIDLPPLPEMNLWR